jgi:hypothetical protein
MHRLTISRPGDTGFFVPEISASVAVYYGFLFSIAT